MTSPSFQGYIDSISLLGIKGWGWEVDNTRAVELMVLVDKEYYCSIVANQERADINSLGIGNHAFCFFDYSLFYSDRARNIDIVFSDDPDQRLIGSPFILGPKSKYCAQNQDGNYFFMHIPKAAGTSIRLKLESLFMPHKICPDAMQMARNNGYYPPHHAIINFISSDKSQYTLVRGHYHYDLIGVFAKRPKIFSVFRDPIQRTLSHLNMLACGDYKKILGPNHSASAREILYSGIFGGLHNIQCKYLGTKETIDTLIGKSDNFLTVIDTSCSKTTSANLAIAKERLHEIDIIGVYDYIDNFNSEINYTFNLSSSSRPITHANASKYIIEVDECMLQYIQDNNEFDIELYYEAKKIVEHRLGINITASHGIG